MIKKLHLIFVSLLFVNQLWSQQFFAGNDTTLCGGGTVTLHAFPLAAVNTGTVTLTDDQYSQVINIGFTFNYFGTNYTQCLLSSNGYLCFDLAGAGGYSQWPISAPIPSTSDPVNSIMGPWEDLYPAAAGSGGSYNYGTFGTAPNRVFVYDMWNITMFSCNNLCHTGQIILYESSNIIEIHIGNKQTCFGWNGGYAIEGIHNQGGNLAFTVPGRNMTQWSATNDAYRFTPTGSGAYTVAPIPYQPYLIAAANNLTWTVNGTTIGTGNTITVTPSVTTTYVVTGGATGACASYFGSDTVTVFISPAFQTTVSGIQNEPCFGNSVGAALVTTTGATPPVTYSWNSTPAQLNAQLSGVPAGTYVVTVSDSLNCTVHDTAVITEPAQLTANLTTTPVTCFGGTDGATLANPLGGVTPYTYSWNSTPVQNNASASSLSAGVYTVTVTDNNACQFTDSIQVTEPPQIQIVTTPVDATCFGSLDGSATANPSLGVAPYTYSWMPGGQTGATAINLGAGTYFVTATDANGCSNAATVTVNEPPQIILDLGNDTAIWRGTSAVLTPYLNQGNVSIQWVPGYGLNDSTSLNVTATPLLTTTYTVTVTDLTTGCTTTDDLVITVKPTDFVTAPSAFTPNGDGLNDKLFPLYGELVKILDFQVFNRWGQMVYKGLDGWDGTNNSIECEIGTYVYIISYTYVAGDNNTYTVHGNTTLLR